MLPAHATLVLALVVGGLGVALHVRWLVAVALLVPWLVGLAVGRVARAGGREGGHHS